MLNRNPDYLRVQWMGIYDVEEAYGQHMDVSYKLSSFGLGRLGDHNLSKSKLQNEELPL